MKEASLTKGLVCHAASWEWRKRALFFNRDNALTKHVTEVSLAIDLCERRCRFFFVLVAIMQLPITSMVALAEPRVNLRCRYRTRRLQSDLYH